MTFDIRQYAAVQFKFLSGIWCSMIQYGVQDIALYDAWYRVQYGRAYVIVWHGYGTVQAVWFMVRYGLSHSVQYDCGMVYFTLYA